MGALISEGSRRFVLVIDTDSYAGNFEREMVAFMTGIVGDCGQGKEEAAAFEKEFPDLDFEDLVAQEPDEHGCWRPASIWNSPYYWNDGMGGHYPNEVAQDDPEVIANYKRRWDEQNEKIRQIYAHDPEYAEECVARNDDKQPGRYPAACSVACFLESRPEEKVLKFLVDRAKRFCAERRTWDGKDPAPLEFKGARLILRRSVDEEIVVF